MANLGTFTKPILPLLIQNRQTYIGVLFSKNNFFIQFIKWALIRISKCHKRYMTIISDQKPYPKEMCEINHTNKIHVDFFKDNLACYPFATIYQSNIFIFLEKYPHSLQFTYKVYLKCQHPESLPDYC